VALDPRTHVESVALRVADADRVARPYEQAAGLRRLAAAPGQIVLSADGERPLLYLNEAPNAPAPPFGSTGLFHTAILFPERAELADALRRFAAAGYRLSGAADHGVSEALYWDDPEGNGVELYWDRPREAWPWTEDGGVAMFTAPLDLQDLLAASRDDGTTEPAVDIGHVHLKVGDIPRAEHFWRDALGMNLMARYGDQASFLAAGDYHHHVGVNTWTSRGGPPAPDGALGLERVTLALPDQATLDATVERLRGSGAEVHEAPGGAHVRDPDGTLVELRA
jgi:catechol 2,3-dioxygenase